MVQSRIHFDMNYRPYKRRAWFWYTLKCRRASAGGARAGPPRPEKEDDASSVGLCKKWHAEERHRQTTRRRVRKYFDDETLGGLDDDASDVERAAAEDELRLLRHPLCNA